ncbi:MAG: preprotein translocase subunit SecY [Verrucomicrobia bacterium]|nr:preprotein translocase subunit SecY [Verrucomicrobiota bacterium]
MLRAFINVFRIHDLRRKVFITLLLLAACRVGAHVPTPGVNSKALEEIMEQQAGEMGGTLLSFVNMFSGGAFLKATILALGIMPYISASIILQLLTAVIPSLERLAKDEGEEGRRKITQYTRYSTVFLCLFQGFFMAQYIEGMNAIAITMPVVPVGGFWFRMLTAMTMTVGTMFLMWVGEQISERGIGNGISLIITVGIISRLPDALFDTWRNLSLIDPRSRTLPPYLLVVLAALFVFVVMAVIVVTRGQRRIPVQQAKRIVGRRIYSGQSSYFPLRVNYAGVIPIIFASSLLMFPATLAQFFPAVGVLKTFSDLLSPTSWLYTVLYTLLIIFFCYFWTATQFDPVKISNDMKKNGTFIPGKRPGKPTAEFLDRTMNRLVLSGAIFLAAIAIFPTLLSGAFRPGVTYTMAQYFGGTGLLIIVGVMLDTVGAVESHLLMRHYDGFMKKGRLRGRY